MECLKKYLRGLTTIRGLLFLFWLALLLYALLTFPVTGRAAARSQVEINPQTQVVMVKGQEMALVPKSDWEKLKSNNQLLIEKLERLQAIQQAQKLTSTEQAQRLADLELANRNAREETMKAQSSQQSALTSLETASKELDTLSRQLKHDRLIAKKHRLQALGWGLAIGMVGGAYLHARLT